VLRTRIVTAAVALPALLILVFLASDRLFLVVDGLCIAWALYEIQAMAALEQPWLSMVAVAAGAVPALFLLLCGGPGPMLLPIAAVVLMLALVGAVAIDRSLVEMPRPLVAIIGSFYAGTLLPYVALLRNLPRGVTFLVLILLIVIATDSAAYATGKMVGFHKLVPAVSPGKTIEGSEGGLVGAIVTGLVLNHLFGVGWGMGKVVIFAALLSCVAQAGDLAESALKRLLGAKDSGWLFPGHGGLLDRADSLVFAAVFTYYYVR